MNESNGQTELGLQALLVSLSFSLCRQSRQSEEEARGVETRNHAQRGVAKVSMFYFRQASEEIVNGKVVEHLNDALGPIKTHNGAWRKAHNQLCPISWDAGTGLLPAKLVQRYMEEKAEFEAKMPELIEEFLSVYPDWRATAPERMGSMFEEEDFPSLDEVREDIGWSCAMIPLPSGEQFRRIKLIAPDLTEQMETSTNAKIAEAVQAARAQTWKDLFAPVQHIVEVLSKDKGKLYETLLGNLHTILDLAPMFNLSEDAQMDQFVAQAKETLGTVTIEDLRTDPALRQSTLQNAQALLASFGDMGRRAFVK